MHDLRYDPDMLPLPRSRPVRVEIDGVGRGAPVSPPDLRTADQRERDDVAALTARVDRLEEALARQADVLQVLLLQQDDGK